MNKQDKIYIAGHRGMVGSAIQRKLIREGYTNFITRTSAELDLRDQQQVTEFFFTEKPDYVFFKQLVVANSIKYGKMPSWKMNLRYC